MSAIPLPHGRLWSVRPKFVLFAFIALMLGYVLYHNEHFLIDAADPSWPHFRVIGRWLLPYGMVGAAALLLGATQFSMRLRSRYTRLHRILGRTNVAAVCVVAPLGIYIQYLDERSGAARSFTIAAIAAATLWLIATLMAFWCIRTRKIEQHRQWVTRSYAMALVFLEVRVVAGVTGWEQLVPDVSETIVWVCVALAYPLADCVLLIEDNRRSRGKSARLA